MELAEVNVALPRAPLDAPVMAGFVKAVGDVNWLAERSDGFVWRQRPDEGDGDGPVILRPFEDEERVIVTLSTWTDFASLQKYVYRTAHALFMGRRVKWFVPLGGFTTALWWVEAGAQPSIDEGLERLDHLRAKGPTPFAFSLRRLFDATGVPDLPGRAR
jgi:uncharacterized protein DUF3291